MRAAPLVVIRAGALYFALVFGAGFLLGMIRVPLLVPQVGERVAELLEAPIMLLVILATARFVVRRFALGASVRLSAAVGLMALALLLAAELLLAGFLLGRTPAEYVLARDPIAGMVYIALLLLFAALPWLHARRTLDSAS